jgi:hypothetical protein
VSKFSKAANLFEISTGSLSAVAEEISNKEKHGNFN